jgi:hypothetical protein
MQFLKKPYFELILFLKKNASGSPTPLCHAKIISLCFTHYLLDSNGSGHL